MKVERNRPWPTVAFVKIRDVKSPSRAHSTDAGTDFFIPELTNEYLEVLREKNKDNKLEYHTQVKLVDPPISDNCIVIPPGEQIMIPSGIKVWIYDKKTYLKAANKSGIASKYHLTVGAKIIDANYQGEIHINLMNVGNVPIMLKGGQKVVQFIHMEYIDTDWQEITEEQYAQFGTTDRGDGGFGSTGNS